MKNVLVANFKEKSKNIHKDDSRKRVEKSELETFVKAQIENSLEVGWKPEDILLMTNFEFEFMNVKANVVDLNKFCLTGSKMFAVKEIFSRGMTDVVWAHDLDAWQNEWFDCPDFLDAGAAEYSQPKYNGGSVFWRKSAIDIIDEIISVLINDKLSKEEPTLNRIFKSEKYRKRITTLNYTYNVGCSGFVPRLNKSIKPIRVCHLHPNNRIAWETHVLDRNGQDEVSVGKRLETVLRKYFPSLATELSEDGKAKASRIRAERSKKLI